MCGLFGAFPLAGNQGKVATMENCMSALEVLKPRGPDDQRIFQKDNWVMGHTRLEILDLDPRSSQPFTDNEGNWLVFNGEIYNYLELRAELADIGEVFETEGDTEVLLKGLVRYGDIFIKRLVGMFSFGWYCQKDNSLLLARDRLGVKPMVYSLNNESILFSSDIRAIQSLDSSLCRRNSEAMALFFMLGYIPSPFTAYKGIEKLEPGSWLKINTRSGHVTRSKYWKIQDYYASNGGLSSELIGEEYEELLDKSISYRLRSDVPMSIMLSGGIDSTLVASRITKMNTFPTAYVMGFNEDEYDESEVATATASYLGLPLEVLKTDESSILEDFESIKSVYDEPFADSSSLPFYYLCKKISRKHKVTMSGDGGDELNLGYPWQMSFKKYRRLRSIPLPMRRVAARLLKNVSRLHYPSKIFGAGSKEDTWAAIRVGKSFKELDELLIDGQRCGEILRAFLAHHSDRIPAESSDIEWFLMMDLVTYLPDDLLVKADKTSMAFGLEVREPLLDHKLIELQLSTSPGNRYAETGVSKLLARNVLNNAGLQFVTSLRKRGFVPPIEIWMNRHLSQIEDISRDRYAEEASFGLSLTNKSTKTLTWDQLTDHMDDRFSQYRWRLLQQF